MAVYNLNHQTLSFLQKQSSKKKKKKTHYFYEVTYFTIFLLFRPLWSSNSILQGDILDKSILFRYWKIWLLLLTKIKFHCAVVAQNMWEEWSFSKNFLTDFEGNAKILSILCIGEFYFITFKVLLIREKN